MNALFVVVDTANVITQIRMEYPRARTHDEVLASLAPLLGPPTSAQRYTGRDGTVQQSAIWSARTINYEIRGGWGEWVVNVMITDPRRQ